MSYQKIENELNQKFISDKIFDLKADQENFQLLQNNNKRIKRLFDEVTRKQTNINKLKERMSQYEKITKEEKENYVEREKILSEQVSLLEKQVHDMEINEKEKDYIISENIERFKQRENDLIGHVFEKEMSIKRINDEYLKLNEDFERCKKEVSQSNSKLLSIEEERKGMERENRQLKEENDLFKKKHLEKEEKAEQLIGIIKTQAEEMQKLYDSLQNSQIEIERLNKEVKDLSDEYERREVNHELRKENMLYKEKNEKLNRLLQEKDDQINDLEGKNQSLLMRITDLTITNESRERYKEYQDYSPSPNHIKEAEYQIEESFNEDMKTFVEEVSKGIYKTMSYIENYLGKRIFYIKDKENEIKAIGLSQLYGSSNKESKYQIEDKFKNSIFIEYMKIINFDHIFSALTHINMKIINEISLIEERNSGLIQENKELLKVNLKRQEEVSSLKEMINSKVEAIQNLENDLIIMSEEIEALKRREEEAKQCGISYLNKEIKCLIGIENDMNRVIDSLNSIKTLQPDSCFIDFDDLKKIYSFKFYKPKERKERNDELSLYEDFKISDFKKNILLFLNFFKSLSEEYVTCLSKLLQLNCVKSELEVIREDFYKNKAIMLKENQLLIEKNYQIERMLKEEHEKEVNKIINSKKEEIEKIKKEKQELATKFDEDSHEKEILNKEIEALEERIESMTKNKSQKESQMNEEIERLFEENIKLEDENRRLLNEVEVLKIKNI